MRSFLTGVKKILQPPEDVLILTRWRCGGMSEFGVKRLIIL